MRAPIPILLLVPLLGGCAGMVGAMNGGAVGERLPAHELRWLGEPPDPTASLRLLDFWATWCKPCRETIPQLNELQRRFAGKGLAIVGVTREVTAEVEPFLREVPMRYAVALDPLGQLHDGLRVKALPFAYLVARDGRIVWRGQPEDLDDALVARLLAREQAGTAR